MNAAELQAAKDARDAPLLVRSDILAPVPPPSSPMKGFFVACLAAALLAGNAHRALAFPHIVRPGETLAQIAERTYGRVEMEQLLVAANGLDAGGGIPIVPGLRLEVPSVGHRRVSVGETWAGLAEELLGDPSRGDYLAMANNAMPWLPPADGQEIVVPYNLRYVAGQNDSLLTIAYRFMGERDKAWMLDRYNHKKGDPIHRGDVVLVPLTDLPLTPSAKVEAGAAGALVRTEGGGQAREAQRRAEVELPALAADLRGGRYVDAIARGNRLLGLGELTKSQIAAIQRHLTEAYVALDATGLAETACGAWREADPLAALDPIELSPKILRACAAAPAPRKPEPTAAPTQKAPLPASASPRSAPLRTRRDGGG